MTYYFYMYQSGGCDYTIGCGEKMIRLAATNHEDAITEIENMVIEYEYDFETISVMKLLEVANETPIDYHEMEEYLKEDD